MKIAIYSRAPNQSPGDAT